MAAVLDTRKLTRRLQESGVPDAQADAIVETVPEVRATDVGQLATKQDVALLKQDLVVLEAKRTGEIRTAVAEARADLLKWLLPFLAGPPLPGSSEPLRLYWTCYSALRANDDPRADGILAAACALLQSRAALISDETRRRTFVHGIDVNRKILRMTNDE